MKLAIALTVFAIAFCANCKTIAVKSGGLQKAKATVRQLSQCTVFCRFIYTVTVYGGYTLVANVTVGKPPRTYLMELSLNVHSTLLLDKKFAQLDMLEDTPKKHVYYPRLSQTSVSNKRKFTEWFGAGSIFTDEFGISGISAPIKLTFGLVNDFRYGQDLFRYTPVDGILSLMDVEPMGLGVPSFLSVIGPTLEKKIFTISTPPVHPDKILSLGQAQILFGDVDWANCEDWHFAPSQYREREAWTFQIDGYSVDCIFGHSNVTNTILKESMVANVSLSLPGWYFFVPTETFLPILSAVGSLDIGPGHRRRRFEVVEPRISCDALESGPNITLSVKGGAYKIVLTPRDYIFKSDYGSSVVCKMYFREADRWEFGLPFFRNRCVALGFGKEKKIGFGRWKENV